MDNFILDMLLSLPLDQTLDRNENSELASYVLNIAGQCIAALADPVEGTLAAARLCLDSFFIAFNGYFQ